MVSNELCLSLLIHAFDWIEGTGEFALESLACLNNLSHNLFTLHLRHTWAKRIVSQVTADSDTSRLDHSSVSSIERWALELCVVHVADVASALCVTMILLNDLIHEWCEGGVRVMRASINADARVDILAS